MCRIHAFARSMPPRRPRPVPARVCTNNSPRYSFSPKMSHAPTAAYIHLPFCRQKCAYCSFPVVVGASTSSSYVSQLLAEVGATARLFGSQTRPLKSLYIGGGTPSLTSSSEMERILNYVDVAIGIDSSCEVTVEMDPGTFDIDKAKAFRRAGVTRASVGAQSFDDALLKACNRIHVASDIGESLRLLREADFGEISLDLISGLPGQSMKTWEASLSKALSLQPQHVSIYDLELDEGTPFGRTYESGVFPLPSEAIAADMLLVTSQVLTEAGYEHYEVSNYARCDSMSGERRGQSGHRSRHNMNYWAGKDFYGFGLGATSLVTLPDGESYRFSRPRALGKYAEYVDSLHCLGHPNDSCQREAHILFPGARPRSLEEKLEDWLINRMRLLNDGVTFESLERAFGEKFVQRVKSAARSSGLYEQGLVSMDRERLAITRKGFVYESSILSTILSQAVWNYFPDKETATHA